MAKRPKAVYEPGELDRVRKNLGEIDPDEARRLAEKLGGEVGIEKTQIQQERKHKTRDETVELKIGGRPGLEAKQKRRIETIDTQKAGSGRKKTEIKLILNPEDDPSIPVKASYRERIKMDRFAAQAEFEIKNSSELIQSVLSIFGEPPDYINPDFSVRRMNEYYSRLENLVTATRTLLPRNNVQRNEALKKENSFYFMILDTIRYWNIEKISNDLARIQSRPRSIKSTDYSDILRYIYKPIYLLEKLDPEQHIREAYKTVYQLIYQENPKEAKIKYQPLIRAALISYGIVTKSIKFYLFPLLLKLLSDRFLSYDEFFIERKNRYEHFIHASEKDRLVPQSVLTPIPDTNKQKEPEDINKRNQQTNEARKKESSKALLKGLRAMETLFPKAGWDKLASFPDLYPYFSDIFNLNKGYELISPKDPMQQIAFLMLILEELFYGLRYVQFGTIRGNDGNPEKADECINSVIETWHDYIERILEKEYLPRLGEYCRILDGSSESMNANYSKRVQMELFWLKRLYFLPFFRFESLGAPPFRKQDITPLYTQVRNFRRVLTAVAAGIEQGIQAGGAEKNSTCDTIDNPWEPYVFQLPNPVSTRLDRLLGQKNPKKKTNAALVFFSLAVITVLDNIINDDNSWAYTDNIRELFRSINGEGIKPLFGVDEHIDTEAIFKEQLHKKM